MVADCPLQTVVDVDTTVGLGLTVTTPVPVAAQPASIYVTV